MSAKRKHTEFLVDKDLQYAVDFQNVDAVNDILNDNTRREMLSERGIDSAFQCAVATRNTVLIKLFLLPIRQASEFIVEQMFKRYCSLGEDPQIIELLQSAVQPAVLAMAFRDQKSMQKSGIGKSSYYLVGPVEIDRLKALTAHMAEHHRKVSSLNSKIRHHAILHSQTWINDIFVEAACNDNRLVISNLLHIGRTLKPSQYVVNEVFVKAVRDTDLSIAKLLISNDESYLSIDQAGFTEALETAIQNENLVSCEWLLSGRFGFTPNQIFMDNVFMTLFIEKPSPLMSLLVNRATPGLKEQMEEDKAKIAAAKERLQRRKNLFRVPMDVDIHQYSRIRVQATASDAQEAGADDHGVVVESEIAERVADRRERMNPRVSLNEAILANMKSRIVERPIQIRDLLAQLVRIIERTLPPDDQDNALRIVGEVLSERSLPIFSVTLEFLQLLPPDKTNIWIQGFLSESIIENSCNPGALERVVTGLRGVGDPQLDAIFAQAEAPHLANIFLTGTFNIFGDSRDQRSAVRATSNARSLAQALVQRGAVMESSAETLTKILRDYAMDSIVSFGENPVGYLDRINAVTEAVIDSFDSHLRSHFEEAIRDRQHREASDGGMSFQDMDSAVSMSDGER